MNIYSGVKRDHRIRNTTNSKFLSKSCKSDPCLNLLENKLSNDSGSAEDESTKADIFLLWHIQQLFFKTYVHQTNDRFSFCFVLFSWLIRVLAKPAVNRPKRRINQEIENGKIRIEKNSFVILLWTWTSTPDRLFTVFIYSNPFTKVKSATSRVYQVAISQSPEKLQVPRIEL